MLLAYAYEEAPMNKHVPSSRPRTVSLFRNGRNQALRIPVEFEFPGNEVTIRKDGDSLIVEAVPSTKPKTFAELMQSFEVIEDEFPEIDDPLPRDIDL
jgi:antitoxin VapB